MLKKKIIEKRKANIPKKSNQMSSEQQTRQNEMLKIMLQRPQQLLPQGMVSQNDELKQKIDTLTRRNVEMKNQYDELRRLQTEGREEAQRLTTDFRHQQEANRIREQNLRNQQAAEDRLHEAQ